MKKIIPVIVILAIVVVGSIFLSNSNSESEYKEEGRVEQIVIPESEVLSSYEHGDEEVVISVGDSEETVRAILGMPINKSEPSNTEGQEYWFYTKYEKVFGMTDGIVSSIRTMD